MAAAAAAAARRLLLGPLGRGGGGAGAAHGRGRSPRFRVLEARHLAAGGGGAADERVRWRGPGGTPRGGGAAAAHDDGEPGWGGGGTPPAARFETGRLARLADGAATLAVGGRGQTAVLATVTAPRTGALQLRRGAFGHDLVPLGAEYREPAAGHGHIPQTHLRRELAASDHEVAVGRAVDRALRPLFPRGWFYDTALTATALSLDPDPAAAGPGGDPAALAISAASAALMVSDLPWPGPVAALRVAEVRGRVVVGPTAAEVAAAEREGGPSVLVAGTRDRVTYVAARGREAPRAAVMGLVRAAHRALQPLLRAQEALGRAAGRPERDAPLYVADEAAVRRVRELAGADVGRLLADPALDGVERGRRLVDLKEEVRERLRGMGALRLEPLRVSGSGCVAPSDLDFAVSKLAADALAEAANARQRRAGGRSLDEVRPVTCEVGAAPMAHGSGLFQVGDTQVLSTATVGGLDDAQRLDGPHGPHSKRFLAHFRAPAFAAGEVPHPLTALAHHKGKIRRTAQGLKEKEIEAMAFLERALGAVVPADEAEFPFCVRLAAEALGDDGSALAAAVGAGSLALRDANVPTTAAVAAVSVGVRRSATAADDDEAYELRVDLDKLEQELGVGEVLAAGTRGGFTAVEVWADTEGLPLHAVDAALAAAEAELPAVLAALDAPARPAEKPARPAFGTVRVKRQNIGKVIGQGGATIKRLEQQTGCKLRVLDTGCVGVVAPTAEAFGDVQGRLREIDQGGARVNVKYKVTVSRIEDYGAFFELPSGASGLLHISEAGEGRIKSMQEEFSVGDSLEVLCIGHDGRGNAKFSRKRLLAAQ